MSVFSATHPDEPRPLVLRLQEVDILLLELTLKELEGHPDGAAGGAALVEVELRAQPRHLEALLPLSLLSQPQV